jgi:hypothetical protein
MTLIFSSLALNFQFIQPAMEKNRNSNVAGVSVYFLSQTLGVESLVVKNDDEEIFSIFSTACHGRRRSSE